MEWNIKAGNLLFRERARDRDAKEMLPGDIYEFTDPPFCEVDPFTYKTLKTLQCFKIGPDGVQLIPVKRGSWETMELPGKEKLLTYKCRECHGWHESTSRKHCTARRLT